MVEEQEYQVTVRLTSRQQALVELIANGRSQIDAAAELGMRVQTAKNHLAAARKNSGAATTSELVARWLNNGRTVITVTQDDWDDIHRRVETLEAMHESHGHE